MEFILRPWELGDVPSVAKYANDKMIADNLRDVFPYPYTEADAYDYVKSCVDTGDEGRICRAIVVGGEAVGSVGAFSMSDVYRKSAEVGYWLARDFWGKGIMTAAVKQVCDEAFDKLGAVRLFAEPYAYNQGSRRVLEKAGFELEGIMKNGVYKNGKLFDYCMYARVKK